MARSLPPKQPARRFPGSRLLTSRHGGLASLLAATLLIASCGGGGGAEEPAPPAPPAPPTGVDAQAVVVSAPLPMPAGCGGDSAGTAYIGAEAEPFVAVNPRDTQHLVAIWQQDRYGGGAARALGLAVSFDGGRRWGQHQLLPFSRCGGALPGSPGDFARATDPWVDFGPDGQVHVMGLALSVGALLPGSSSAMLAARSSDGGRSFAAAQQLVLDGPTLFNDKNALTADPTDPRYVYAVWDRIDNNDNGPTLLARSVTAGASWEPAREIYVPRVPAGSSGSSQTIGNRIVVRPDGGLVNVFTQIDTVAGREEAWLGVIRSGDKGQTWSAPVRIAALQAVGAKDPQTGKAIRDGAILASIVAAPDGSLTVAWQDARFSGGQRDAIVISRSGDGGSSWSVPRAVNRVATSAAFTPTLAVRADGRLGLLHYDLREDTADASTLLASAWLLSSGDGGQTWTETRVREAFDLNRAPDSRGWFLGDYQGLVASGTAWVAVFVATTADAANRSEVYALRVEASGAGAPSRAQPLNLGVQRAVPADTPAFAQARREAIQRSLQLWRRPR